MHVLLAAELHKLLHMNPYLSLVTCWLGCWACPLCEAVGLHHQKNPPTPAGCNGRGEEDLPYSPEQGTHSLLIIHMHH
jgi:hypothetical protein